MINPIMNILLDMFLGMNLLNTVVTVEPSEELTGYCAMWRNNFILP